MVYVAMIPVLTETARDCGYALAVHGSLARDLDLVAIPWTEEAQSAEHLLLRLLSVIGYVNGHLPHRNVGDDGSTEQKSHGDLPAKKPHGRLSWNITFDNGLFIDLSVMPRASGGA